MDIYEVRAKGLCAMVVAEDPEKACGFFMDYVYEELNIGVEICDIDTIRMIASEERAEVRNCNERCRVRHLIIDGRAMKGGEE